MILTQLGLPLRHIAVASFLNFTFTLVTVSTWRHPVTYDLHHRSCITKCLGQRSFLSQVINNVGPVCVCVHILSGHTHAPDRLLYTATKELRKKLHIERDTDDRRLTLPDYYWWWRQRSLFFAELKVTNNKRWIKSNIPNTCGLVSKRKKQTSRLLQNLRQTTENYRQVKNLRLRFHIEIQPNHMRQVAWGKLHQRIHTILIT